MFIVRLTTRRLPSSLFLPQWGARRSNHHTHSIVMPALMDGKEGVVDKWLLKEGDKMKSGQSICEITVSDLAVAIEAPDDGVLSRILVEAGKTVPINHSIAEFVDSMDDFIALREAQRIALVDKMKEQEVADAMSAKNAKVDTKVLLREIKHLIQHGDIEDGSEFAKKLQQLARKGDSDIMSIFEASFDGDSFNEESFDKSFFISNAKDIVEEKNN